MSTTRDGLICRAITERRLLAFEYNGRARIVQPYCHGWTNTGAETLRAIQVAGDTSSRPISSGKLWTVTKMQRVQLLDETFVPNDPHYNPNDSALSPIHCRISSGWSGSAVAVEE